MTLSLDAALSGMLEQERNLELIANNLSNVNTTGYKRAVVQFQDVLNTAEIIDALSGQLPVDEATVAAGVETEAPRREFTQERRYAFWTSIPRLAIRGSDWIVLTSFGPATCGTTRLKSNVISFA